MALRNREPPACGRGEAGDRGRVRQPPGDGQQRKGAPGAGGLGRQNPGEWGPGSWRASVGGPALPQRKTLRSQGRRQGELATGRPLVTRAVGARDHKPDEEG